jgi:hypothetical protein
VLLYGTWYSLLLIKVSTIKTAQMKNATPMSNRMGTILKGVTYKMQPNIITYLSYFYLFQRYQECHKQCDITTDAENVPHYPSLFKEQWTHNSFSRQIASETDFYTS